MKIIKPVYSEEQKLLLVGDIFETENVSDTYTNSGQKVGSSDAGDYLSITKAFSISDSEGELIELEEGQIVSDYDDNELYQKIWDLSSGKDTDNVHFEYDTCKSHTYWDGHNFKTISIEVENGDPTHEVCEGEEFDKMITEYESAEKIKDVPGGEVWKSENFIYQKSFWQGHFEIATVETIEDYEYRISGN